MAAPADLPDVPPVQTRVYGAVFGRVWIAAMAAVRAIPRWTVQKSDPMRGHISIEARAGWLRPARTGEITISLDDLGLTRVGAAFAGPAGEADPALNRRQIERFFKLLERALSADAVR